MQDEKQFRSRNVAKQSINSGLWNLEIQCHHNERKVTSIIHLKVKATPNDFGCKSSVTDVQNPGICFPSMKARPSRYLHQCVRQNEFGWHVLLWIDDLMKNLTIRNVGSMDGPFDRKLARSKEPATWRCRIDCKVCCKISCCRAWS